MIAGASAGSVLAAGLSDSEANQVRLPLIQDPNTEQKEEAPDANLPPEGRIGYAVVGLGHLSLSQILPALSHCKYSKVAPLVSGDRRKALKIARQYGTTDTDVYNYHNFERLADNPSVQAVYIVLPNSMHKEYTLCAAKTGKHVLCEKPMATSVADCQAMINACRRAGSKLMIAYRSQYERMDRMIATMVKEQKLGILREFVAGNSQNVGDPAQWRMKKAFAGGGAIRDIGLHCLNAARFLSSEEPLDVMASVHKPDGDPRFVEVEESVQFILRFPSGLTATCMSSYASHESRFFWLQRSQGWVEMDPAFGYNGLRMRHGMLIDGKSATTEVQIDPQDQFAREIDHMSVCVKSDITPHTPGEEGLQDRRIIEADLSISAHGTRREDRKARFSARGPDPQEETFRGQAPTPCKCS
ncbi:oxidoreductase domain-containing protein [Caballeronia terrestris]|uniref:Oxidoreductase domain-containing protein n=1 Tax=Caballeronia terrestris TaxID=1226301 RepID=A0A158K8L3_9BURK|nr:Gfo/Idh/MocA family oxidoreductase [Caballeronia terrestris]SAL77375.1 oxidoreductase domain-containing protein [Caballeronia terrestris]